MSARVNVTDKLGLLGVHATNTPVCVSPHLFEKYRQPSKHEMLTQCWDNVVPAS